MKIKNRTRSKCRTQGSNAGRMAALTRYNELLQIRNTFREILALRHIRYSIHGELLSRESERVRGEERGGRDDEQEEGGGGVIPDPSYKVIPRIISRHCVTAKVPKNFRR